MADVRCPKCGKPNPSDAEVCRHCQQLLKPVQGKNDAPSQPSRSNEPDWLRELRSDGGSVTPGAQDESTEQSPEAQIPDWLARIRQRGEETAPADTGSDWLSGLRTTGPAEPAPQESEPGGEDAWLNSLQNWQTPAEDSSTGSAQGLVEPLQPAEESSPDLSAWLRGMDEQDETTRRAEPEIPWGTPPKPEETDQFPTETPELETWLQSLDGAENQQPSQPAAANQSQADSSFGLSDWLDKMEEQPEQITSAEPAEAAPARESFGITGWLQNLEAPAPSQPSESADMPSWLSETEETTAAAAEPPAAVPNREEIPSWLSGLEETAAEAQIAAAPESEIPTWLSGTQETPPVSSAASDDQIPAWLAGDEEPPAPAPLPTRAPTEELPSWMAGFSAEKPSDATPETVKSPADELPSWMMGFDAETEAVGKPSAPAEPLPAWMDQMEVETPAAAQPPAAADMPSWLGDADQPEAAQVVPSTVPSPSAELPADDWLTAFGKIGAQPPVQAEPAADFGIPGWQTTRDATKETPSTPLPFIEENLPSWLNSVDQAAPVAESTELPALIEEPETAASFDQGAPFQVELPDWIGEEPAQHPSDAASGDEEPQYELAQAELPSWVEEMRPVESAIGGDFHTDTDQRVEKAGPLAGLRGILPSEELTARYRKLPVYSVKLRVSERQRQYINLLENVIALENQPQTVPPTPSQTPQYILRLAIGLLLIVALLLPPLFNIQVAPLPSVAPAGMLELYNIIETLPPNAPVLLAVDYEPALAGEMQLASSAVIEHLMVKNARIAVVSTVPTGPIMAQQLIQSVHLRQPGFDLATHTVNLSYLAGGTTSLLEFANRPQQAAPVALDSTVTGDLPWQRPALQGIQRLQDFTLVIVLTDNAENGRAWIEQVQPMLGQTPLTMVTSAQAAPLLLPYLESQQVRGLVSGLYGGAMYEKRSGRISLTPGYYMGYQGAFLVGILVLFLGGTISLALSMTRRSKKGKA